MAKTIPFKSVLSSKRASGSIYLGFMIMIIAFVAILVCVNLFQLYTLNTQVQIISDAIADGSASAGLTMLSFDETKMRKAADDIFDYNNLPGLFMTYSISVENEIDEEGTPTNNKLITVEVFGRKQAFNRGLISVFTNVVADNEYAAKGRSVVRAEVKTLENSWIEETLLKKPENYQLPFVPTEPKNRNANYVNWLIDYYLCPEYNPVYQKPDSAIFTRADWLLYDYITCMGITGMSPEFRNFSYILEDLKTNQPTGFGSWTRFNNAGDMQANAEQGKPTIIICETPLGLQEVYIIVPQKNRLQPGEFAAAYANNTNSNYEVMQWDDFCATHQHVFALGCL